jgi:hypothetical protein
VTEVRWVQDRSLDPPLGSTRRADSAPGGFRRSREPPGCSPGVIGHSIVRRRLRARTPGRISGFDPDVVDLVQASRPESRGPFQAYDKDFHPSSPRLDSEHDASSGSGPGVFPPRVGLNRDAAVFIPRQRWVGAGVSNAGCPCISSSGPLVSDPQVDIPVGVGPGSHSSGGSGAGPALADRGSVLVASSSSVARRSWCRVPPVRRRGGSSVGMHFVEPDTLLPSEEPVGYAPRFPCPLDYLDTPSSGEVVGQLPVWNVRLGGEASGVGPEPGLQNPVLRMGGMNWVMNTSDWLTTSVWSSRDPVVVPSSRAARTSSSTLRQSAAPQVFRSDLPDSGLPPRPPVSDRGLPCRGTGPDAGFLASPCFPVPWYPTPTAGFGGGGYPDGGGAGLRFSSVPYDPRGFSSLHPPAVCDPGSSAGAAPPLVWGSPVTLHPSWLSSGSPAWLPLDGTGTTRILPGRCRPSPVSSSCSAAAGDTYGAGPPWRSPDGTARGPGHPGGDPGRRGADSGDCFPPGTSRWGREPVYRSGCGPVIPRQGRIPPRARCLPASSWTRFASPSEARGRSRSHRSDPVSVSGTGRASPGAKLDSGSARTRSVTRRGFRGEVGIADRGSRDPPESGSRPRRSCQYVPRRGALRRPVDGDPRIPVVVVSAPDARASNVWALQVWHRHTSPSWVLVFLYLQFHVQACMAGVVAWLGAVVVSEAARRRRPSSLPRLLGSPGTGLLGRPRSLPPVVARRPCLSSFWFGFTYLDGPSRGSLLHQSGVPCKAPPRSPPGRGSGGTRPRVPRAPERRACGLCNFGSRCFYQRATHFQNSCRHCHICTTIQEFRHACDHAMALRWASGSMPPGFPVSRR